ncbi:MAG: hypothetical protein K6E73_03720 [Bacteroidales bacterium]|nr:hypothetical protein [Bacteroidales bacterium]
MLKFFDYESCFRYYASKIINVRQAKIKGEFVVAKPMLLLSVIDLIDAGEVTDNRIHFDDRLEDLYFELMRQYVRDSGSKVTPAEYPYWHLQSDGFWHLHGVEMPETMKKSVSRRFLIDNVDYAYFDPELWLLLQNECMRARLRDYIVEHKLPHCDDSLWRIVADGIFCLFPVIMAC